MNSRFFYSFIKLVACACVGVSAAQAGPIDIVESCVNIDDTVYDVAAGCLGNPTPGSITDSIGADGLGTVEVSLTGAGAHYVSLYVDAEIDQVLNTFFNEFGFLGGVPAPGQSFEIDEPGFVSGDIYNNFLLGALDNSINGFDSLAHDVAMAIAFDFVLAADETAEVTFSLGEVAPESGLWLRQFDPDSGLDYFLSGMLEVRGVPISGTLYLMGLGLLGLCSTRKKKAEIRTLVRGDA